MVFVDSMIKEVPPITKVLCGSAVLLYFLSYLNYLSVHDTFYSVDLVFRKFQVWRLVTNLLYDGETGIFMFFRLMMLYRCSSRLENHTFRNKPADYIFFLLFGTGVMTIYGSFAGFDSHSRTFLTMLLYIWSRYNQNVVLVIFGILPMKAAYITWFYVFLDVLHGNSVQEDILGIVLSHFFYFFHEIYPKLPLSKDVRVLKTPALLEKAVNLINIKSAETAFFEDEF